jgi:hypothetical protein
MEMEGTITFLLLTKHFGLYQGTLLFCAILILALGLIGYFLSSAVVAFIKGYREVTGVKKPITLDNFWEGTNDEDI